MIGSVSTLSFGVHRNFSGTFTRCYQLMAKSSHDYQNPTRSQPLIEQRMRHASVQSIGPKKLGLTALPHPSGNPMLHKKHQRSLCFLNQLQGMQHAKKRVAKDNPHWTTEQLNQGFEEYLKFWILKQKQGVDAHLPMLSDTVDQFWHAHILHTVLYAKECQLFFNAFLHHKPYTTLTESETKQRFDEGKQSFENFQKLYQQEFGQNLPSPWHDAIAFVDQDKSSSSRV